jgi:electron transport complex protein RnfA
MVKSPLTEPSPVDVVLVLFAAMRERIAVADVPEVFQGAPITLVTAGIMSIAFMGFSGLVKL